MKYSDNWFNFPLSFVIDGSSFLGVYIWFLLEIYKEHFSLEFMYVRRGESDEESDGFLLDLCKMMNKDRLEWLAKNLRVEEEAEEICLHLV